VLIACREYDPWRPFTDQAIFQHSNYIRVPFYTYTDPLNEKTYTFHGTSNDVINQKSEYEPVYVIPYNHFDTISSQPVFAWEKTNAKNVMVAIFNERISIDYSKGQISNINSIVWAWNTGMSSGQEGAISYVDGCDVREGIIQYDKTPSPLEKRKDYILAIWAWNDNLEIEFSSREIPFTVEK
jgi:hypothetical protein